MNFPGRPRMGRRRRLRSESYDGSADSSIARGTEAADFAKRGIHVDEYSEIERVNHRHPPGPSPVYRQATMPVYVEPYGFGDFDAFSQWSHPSRSRPIRFGPHTPLPPLPPRRYSGTPLPFPPERFVYPPQTYDRDAYYEEGDYGRDEYDSVDTRSADRQREEYMQTRMASPPIPGAIQDQYLGTWSDRESVATGSRSNQSLPAASRQNDEEWSFSTKPPREKFQNVVDDPDLPKQYLRRKDGELISVGSSAVSSLATERYGETELATMSLVGTLASKGFKLDEKSGILESQSISTASNRDRYKSTLSAEESVSLKNMPLPATPVRMKEKGLVIHRAKDSSDQKSVSSKQSSKARSLASSLFRARVRGQAMAEKECSSFGKNSIVSSKRGIEMVVGDPLEASVSSTKIGMEVIVGDRDDTFNARASQEDDSIVNGTRTAGGTYESTTLQNDGQQRVYYMNHILDSIHEDSTISSKDIRTQIATSVSSKGIRHPPVHIKVARDGGETLATKTIESLPEVPPHPSRPALRVPDTVAKPAGLKPCLSDLTSLQHKSNGPSTISSLSFHRRSDDQLGTLFDRMFGSCGFNIPDNRTKAAS